ncbi:MAG: methyltransferase [Bacteroidaceae bacterium]|nr:methyltransferase [Bacteroidaceae bacterium]
MPNDFFLFKQFRIRHDRCAMKVGTDGVLLGAWGDVAGSRILDIGTGTGLIALMAAQRNPEAEVLGIDIDEAAVQQAQENIAESPFHERVSCKLQDVLTFQPDTRFDAILCNPPFFTEDTLPDDKGRALARNNRSLPFQKLIPKVAALLNDDGKLSIVIPSQLVQELVGLCLIQGLHLQRRCMVHTTAKKPPRRALLTFSKKQGKENEEQELCLMNPDGNRSEAYSELTKDFYL